MKKYLALILGVIFVLSFAASAFAIHAEIPSETQAVVAKGATQITLGGELRTRGWWRNNIDDAKNPVDTGSSAYYDQRVRLSVDATVAPGIKGYVMVETNSDQSDLYIWGKHSNSPGNIKPTDLHINEAWILYTGSGLLGFNSGLKIGHMPLALGMKEFFDHTKFGDDAIVFFMDPTKQIHIGLLTVKFDELNRGDNTDDTDGYVALMTYKLDDKASLGINYTYLNNSDGEFSHQNIGIHGNASFGGVNLKGAADYQFGDAGPDSDFKGWAAMLGVDFKLNPVTVRVSGAYGTGQEEDEDDTDAFVAYLGADQHYTLIYEYLVNSAAGNTATGLNNTGYINVGVDYAASKDLSMSVDGYWLVASEDNAAGEDEIGWEVDAKLKYALARNLTYQIDAGYFDAGDFYGNDNEGVTVLRHTLTLNF